MIIELDNVIFNLQRAGGISKFWAKHIENLIVQNSEVILHEFGDAQSSNLFRSQLYYPDNIKINSLNSKLLSISRYLAKFKHESGSVFHSSYFRNPSNKNIPTVHTVHDFMYEKFDSGIRKKTHILQKSLAMKRADIIVCVSDKTKADMYELYPWTQGKDVRVIHNGVDNEFYSIALKENNININNKLLEDQSFLLYVGSRGYCKNFPMVLSLFNSTYCKDNKLKLVCVGGGSFNPSELEYIQSNSLGNNVIKFENIDSDQLNLLYNYALALLMPSHYEGFGIPALEASKTGCIVLGANNSSIPEVIGDNSFLFEPTDLISGLEKLELLDNEEEVIKSRQQNISFSSGFSWSKMSQEYFNLYKGLVK